MQITVSDDVNITDVDTFTAFSLRSTLASETIDARLRAAGLGHVTDGHAWIYADELEQRGAALSARSDWVASYRGMTEFARAKGWWSESDRSIRAHIVTD